MFKVLLSIGTVWIVCIILTVSGVLSEDSAARTDKKVEILMDAPWLRLPYPGNVHINNESKSLQGFESY